MLNIGRMQEQLMSIGGTYILNHALRTLLIARKIAEMEKLVVDDDILVFSCYFHDISAFKPYRPEGLFDHADESSKLMPALAADYSIPDDKINTIIEAVKYHDKPGKGTANETKLLRNADTVDYLGFIAVARDFSKQPNDMSKAIAALKKHLVDFSSLLELNSAIQIAQPRIQMLELFLSEFEKESFGLY